VKIDKDKFIKKFGEIELEKYNEEITIKNFCSTEFEKIKDLKKSQDSLAPILRTALVINWKVEMMEKRYKRFIDKFPEISTLKILKEHIDNTSPIIFCKEYLDINANKNTPENNPKYMLLKELTDGFLEYKESGKYSSEIEAIHDWASNLNLSKLNEDPIGKRFGVGPGVVENIRLNLGYSVMKPDRHVIGVLKKIFNINILPKDYITLSEVIGIDAFYLDRVIFEYGRVKGISA
jgi:hypothetical protein